MDKRSKLLHDIVDNYENPEVINSLPDGAPSKRILSIISEYERLLTEIWLFCKMEYMQYLVLAKDSSDGWIVWPICCSNQEYI